MTNEDKERFWQKVLKTETCWQWLSHKDEFGYGTFWVGRGVKIGQGKPRTKRAHRVAYELLVGAIPKGLTLDHLCRNKSCVNPAHLEPCGSGENAARSPNAPYWVKARSTHCSRGHEYTKESTATHHGRRECRKCNAFKGRRKTKMRGTTAVDMCAHCDRLLYSTPPKCPDCEVAA